MGKRRLRRSIAGSSVGRGLVAESVDTLGKWVRDVLETPLNEVEEALILGNDSSVYLRHLLQQKTRFAS